MKSKEKTSLFNGREEIHRRIQEIVEKFRQKGATNAEKAMTIQELGLPSRFKQVMPSRLGQTGIFVEVKGKYYLNEERLRQFQEQRANSGSIGYGGRGMHSQPPPSWFRVAGVFLMLPVGIIVALALIYFVGFRGVGYHPGELLIILLVIALIMPGRSTDI